MGTTVSSWNMSRATPRRLSPNTPDMRTVLLLVVLVPRSPLFQNSTGGASCRIVEKGVTGPAARLLSSKSMYGAIHGANGV